MKEKKDNTVSNDTRSLPSPTLSAGQTGREEPTELSQREGKKETMKKKKIYVSPTIEVTEIDMEQGIASGSIAPGSGTNDVVDEWDEEDQDHHFEWDYQP